MGITKILRRDGELIDFDRVRIENAIASACEAAGEGERSFIPVLTDFIVKDLEHVFGEIFVNRTATVEDVQDIVERNLVKFNKYEVAKKYILYRERKNEKREEKKEKLIKQFEKNTLKVRKTNGETEFFDIDKIKAVFDRAVVGYEQHCTFEDLLEAFKKNIVDDISTSDINKLLVKTCVDLVTVENIHWQEIAARIFLGNLYKKATKNRGIAVEDIYTPDSYLSLFKEYVEAGLYSKDFFEYYSENDIREAGARIQLETDMTYGYTTVLSLAKRYLLNPNKVVKELPQEMYMSVALFLAMPEPKETRLEFAFRIYEGCSTQKISLPTPTLINARTNYHQLSSCFKMNIDDDLRGIYHGIENMAQISKFGGGIGVYL